MPSQYRRLFLAIPLFPLLAVVHAADLRIGIIGLDTSHATAFTEILNNPDAKDHVAGAARDRGLSGWQRGHQGKLVPGAGIHADTHQQVRREAARQPSRPCAPRWMP
jgi:hypothetical protein